jgi:hypothetical protein
LKKRYPIKKAHIINGKQKNIRIPEFMKRKPYQKITDGIRIIKKVVNHLLEYSSPVSALLIHLFNFFNIATNEGRQFNQIFLSRGCAVHPVIKIIIRGGP